MEAFAPVGIFLGGVDRLRGGLARQAAGYRTGHAANGCADRAAKGACCGTRSGAAQGSTDPGSDGMGTRFIGQRVTVGIVEIRHRSSPVG